MYAIVDGGNQYPSKMSKVLFGGARNEDWLQIQKSPVGLWYLLLWIMHRQGWMLVLVWWVNMTSSVVLTIFSFWLRSRFDITNHKIILSVLLRTKPAMLIPWLSVTHTMNIHNFVIVVFSPINCFFLGVTFMQKLREGANKQVISSQADSLIKISRIWADFFPANTSNQPI
ncbi:hypothetical protein L8S34_23075, partial [Enterobacter roggenkampii]|uniref:hypothetical protein n=1 Tax=Enterobacter roggenkampii TaxID=1812935 RepID=UPI0020041DB1